MSVNISRPSISGYGASAVSMSFDTNTLVISNAQSSSKTGTFSTFTFTPPGSGGTGNVWSSAITVNGTSNSEFGQSVSMNYDGTRIAVGAPNIGKVYIYDWTGSGWSNYSNIIQCPVTTSSNNFGFSVSISPDLGDRVAIGAPGINTAYIYELKSNNQWTQTWKHQETTLKSLIKCATSVNSSGYVSVDSEYNNYGYSVALSLYGDFLAIGAPGTDLAEVSNSNSDHTSTNFINATYNPTGNIKFGPHVSPDDSDMEVVGQLGFVQVYKGGLTNTQSWWTSNALVGQTMYGDAGVHEVNFDLTGSGANWFGTSRWWKEPWSMPRMGFAVDISDDGTRVVAGSPSFSMKGYQNETYVGKIELFDFSSSLNAWVKSLSPVTGATMRGCTGHSFKLNSSNNRIVTQDLNSGGFSIMDYSGSSWYQNGNKHSWMSGTPTYGDTVLTTCTITNGSLIVSANPGQNSGQVQFYDYLLTNTLAGNTLIGGYMAADEIFLGPSDNSLTNAYDKRISFGGTYNDNNASLCTIERRVHNSSDLTGASELHIRHQGETQSDHIRLNAPELIFQVGGSDSVTAHMHINKEGNIGIGTALYENTFISSVGDHWLSRSACTAGVDIDKDVQIRNKLNVNYAGRTALSGASGHTISRADTRDNTFVLSNWAGSSQNVSYSSVFRAYEFTGGNSYVQGSSESTHGGGARFGFWLYLKDDHSTYTANNSKGQLLCALGTIPTPGPTAENRYQGCSLYLFYNSSTDRGLRFWLGESNRYYVHQMDFVKNRWYCIDVKFPGQYSGNTTTTLQPKFYDGVGNGGEGGSNAPNNIEDKKNHMLLLVDAVGKNISVSGGGNAGVSQGCISNPSGFWFGGNNNNNGHDGYGINNVYMGLMYKIGGSGHQSAQPSDLFANGSPPEILCVGGDILTNGRIGVGTVQPNAACHVIGDINVEGELRQNNSTLIGLGSSSSAGAPLQVLASTSNTSPTNNGIFLSQTGTSGTNHAIMAMKVNGVNSGDPFVSWDTDVTGWCMGIDNSDDDKLKISNSTSSLNTDTHMEFSSSGTNFKKTILANGSAGTSGQVLTSSGSGGTVSWTTVSGGGGGSSLSGTNTFEWGTGVSGKETNAGKIGYSTWSTGTNDALDIVGAGTSTTNRAVRIWDKLGIGTSSPEAHIHTYIGDHGESNVYIQAYSDSSGNRAALFLGTPHYNDSNSQPKCAIIADAVGWSRADLHFCVEGTANNGSAYRASTSNSRMMIHSTSGRVGIGTTSPTQGLLVVSGSGSGQNLSYAILSTSGVNTGQSGNQYYGIYATNRVAGWAFHAFSDRRIKKNISDINDSSALDKIRLLEPKIYNYIDEKQQGTDTVYGFIAQEVANVLPYAVTVGEGDIPNILTNSNVSVTSDSNVLELRLDTTVEGLTLSNTSNINITTDNNQYLTVPVLSFSGSNVITIQNSDKFTNVTGAYIHGEHIQDFNNLNKDAIWAVSTAALQEVDRQLQTEKTKVATLETQVADLLARVTALENA